MNDDLNDTQLDAALEALARPEPPADHVAQVLARTGPAAGTGGRAGSPSRPSLLWPAASVATAAAVVAAIGLTWQLNREMEQRLGAATAGWDPPSPVGSGVRGSRPSLIDGSQWGAPQEIDRPVLPPQAYWGMDAFTEFERLRPSARTRSGAQDHRNTGTQGSSTGRQGRRGGGADAETAAWAAETARGESWPYQPTLPPIELEPIEPAPLVVAPLVVAPLAPLEDIAIADIPLAPIVIAPLTEEERP